MEINRVKYNLNQTVIHNGAEYIFIGCTLRLGDDGFYYEGGEDSDKNSDSDYY